MEIKVSRPVFKNEGGNKTKWRPYSWYQKKPRVIMRERDDPGRPTKKEKQNKKQQQKQKQDQIRQRVDLTHNTEKRVEISASEPILLVRKNRVEIRFFLISTRGGNKIFSYFHQGWK